MSDFHTMQDADLESSLYDMGDDDGGTSTPDEGQESATTPPGEEPGAEETPVDPPAEGGELEDDGPGDRKIALQKAREAERAAKAEAAAYRAQVEEFQRQQAQAAEAARHREAQAEYNRLLEEEGEEAATAFAARYEAGEYKTALERVEQEKVQIRIQASAEAFMEATPDYVTRIQHLYDVLGQATVDRMAAEKAAQGINPAKWAYQLQKERFPTQADIDARIQEGVAAKLKEAQNKTIPPATRGHETIGHISSGTQAPVAKKTVRKMSDAELNASLYE